MANVAHEKLNKKVSPTDGVIGGIGDVNDVDTFKRRRYFHDNRVLTAGRVTHSQTAKLI